MARQRLTAAQRRWLVLMGEVQAAMGADYAARLDRQATELIKQAFELGKRQAEAEEGDATCP